ncbi:twin-arginine translocase subunit TatC [Candidatus Woesearchaeota archaeon]|nr:twin-arginine translocase subunit TatC [Candidatus Woesearchaeota archaeon]
MREAIISHLEELRARMVIVLITIAVLFVAGFFASDYVLRLLEQSFVTSNISLVSTTPLEFVYAKMKIGLWVSLMLSFPLIVYEAFMFVRPAMRKHEKRLLNALLPFSMFLFLAGAAFCYFILLKLGLGFFASMASEAGVENLWNVNKFVSFVFISCASLGLIFQMPIIIYLLNKLGIISVETLKNNRRYVIVGIFVFAAAITPPDVVSQVLVAIPVLVLYEVSILIVRILR